MININNKILFWVILAASITFLDANYNENLILKKGSSEQIINFNDFIYIKANFLYNNPVSKHGNFNSLDKLSLNVPFPDAAVPSIAIFIIYSLFF